MDENTLISAVGGFVASIIGGGLGGWLTIKAADKSHQHALKLEEVRHRDDVKSFLQAIYDEMDTLWQAYQLGIGQAIGTLKDGEALNLFFPVQQDYFTVYRANARLIGSVDDHNLRRQIVVTYTRSNAIIDSIRLNNHLLAEWDAMQRISLETQNPLHKHYADARLQGLIEYANKLKISDAQLRQDVELLKAMLMKKEALAP